MPRRENFYTFSKRTVEDAGPYKNGNLHKIALFYLHFADFVV